jgi:dCMP deaminase
MDGLTGWDRRFYDLAVYVASWSKDPSTKVGAVLVGGDRRLVALGYNGFPPGIADADERLDDRECRHRLMQHAERNVLDNARFDARGGTLYVTFFPCSECAKSVVSRGIVRVVCPPAVARDPWASDSFWSDLLFSEARIEVVYVERAV